MLNMRIVQAPLRKAESEVVLGEYNRLTGGHIPLSEFEHWTTKSPAGAAWHAILETDDGQLAGHTSVFPLRIQSDRELVPAKSEYSFLHENFRKEKIRGLETAGRPAFIILLDRLFQHCQERGWGPIFASTNEKNQVFTRKVGLRPIEFPLWECLLVLRPAKAAKTTPNLSNWQRAALFAAGIGQGAAWPLAAQVLSSVNGVRTAAVDEEAIPPGKPLFSFFEDQDSLGWRYFDHEQYVRFGFHRAPSDYLIAKRGRDSSYLRVCQWNLNSTGSLASLCGALVREARRSRALGVRWAVYEGNPGSNELVKRMRHWGFLCARRTRIVMIHKKDEQFLDPSLWGINDSLFSFDP